MHASVGDYIITGVRGEQYPCKPDIFEQTYEPADAPAASPWHRVEEPPKGYGAFAACCVYDGKICWFKAIYLDGKWLREMDGVELPVNYWMEIPEPPKEDA